MAIARSGPISFSTLQGEFGGSHPISMYEYRNGGGLVTAGISYSNYGTGISGMSLPSYTGAYNLAQYRGADVANVYTTVYSGGTSPVKTAWSNPVSSAFNVSTYLGALAGGDTFAVCARATDYWPSGWSYAGYNTVTIACTYGYAASATAPQYGTKQFRIYCSYDGGNTVTIGGYYSGSSTGYTYGQVALQGIVRTN
jgi:hypothetical protein